MIDRTYRIKCCEQSTIVVKIKLSSFPVKTSMFLIFSFIAAVVLAIPTWGCSLIVFFFIKNWFDTLAMSSLLGAAVAAMRNKVSEERYHINRAAIEKVFNRFAVEPRQIVNADGGTTFYWSVLRHPMIDGGRKFSVRFAYTPRNGTRNTVFIKAAPGRNLSVLSVDDIASMAKGLGILAPMGNPVSHARATDDKDVKQMILQAAQSSSLEIDFPNLRYGEVGDFVERGGWGVEYFPGFSRMRFWVDIGEYSYSVVATNLNPTAKDAGSVSIWSKQDGPAERPNVASI